MEVIGIMLVGVWFGKRFCSDKCKNTVEKIQFYCVIALIFLMGVTLGKTDGFLKDITSLGLASFVYAVMAILFSTAIVYLLTRNNFGDGGDEQ